MKKLFYIIVCFTNILYADIQKSYTVQNAIKKHDIKETDTHYKYDFSTLFTHVNGLKTAIDLLHERYKDQKINGYIALTENSFSMATVLGYMKGVPIYQTTQIPTLAPDGYYVLISDILKTGKKIQEAIESIQAKQCHVVEVSCLTEIPQLNGRSKINAQIFSIFIERFPKKKP